ncbi:MAG: nuclease A inhibitor family protein [Myxococcota bacterium]
MSLVTTLALVGCTTHVAPDARDPASGRFAAGEGTPEALGMLAFVNDPATTVTVLDGPVGLDARAATGIVAHRDGPDATAGTPDDDAFGTLAELDRVYYVGDSALTAILAYAEAEGWVARDPDDVLGTWDGVTFTLGEAEAVLGLVNTAEHAELDVDAALDVRAADAIVAARPIDTMGELAGLSYVGTSALEKLRGFAGVEVWTTAELEAAFAVATDGILFPSESDFPLDPVFAAGAYPVDAATLTAALGLPPAEVEQRSVDAALGFLVTPADWWTDDELARAADWSAILEVIDHLDHPLVFRVGEIHIDVYVVGGSAEGDLVGFHTVSIET